MVDHRTVPGGAKDLLGKQAAERAFGSAEPVILGHHQAQAPALCFLDQPPRLSIVMCKGLLHQHMLAGGQGLGDVAPM
jgi:hypothetical protein